MRLGELLKKSPADAKQIDRWQNHGITIGSKGRGSGNYREYDENDVAVTKVLAHLSPLIGSGGRTIPYAKVMKKVATQVRAEPSIADREHVFVSATGVISETPIQGWVVTP